MNSTQVRALSAGILLALEEDFHCEFQDEATDRLYTVGAAINYLKEYNSSRTTKVSLAKSAENYWLKPVTPA